MEGLGVRFCETMAQRRPSDSWSLTWGMGQLPPASPWKEYKEHASARFRCTRCTNSWHSEHVTLFFHMNLPRKRRGGGRVGTVKGCILRQYCKDCGVGVPGTPHFEEEDIDIILHNLVIHIQQKCYGLNVKDKLRPVPTRGSTHGYHRSDLCEACRLGVCKWTSHSEGPAWRPGRQQRLRHESNENVQIPIGSPTIASQGMPDSDYQICRCCCCCCIIVIFAMWVVFLVCQRWFS